MSKNNQSSNIQDAAATDAKNAEVWSPGDTCPPDESGEKDLWTCGIHVKRRGSIHGNAIEFHGMTKDEAEKRRDFVLANSGLAAPLLTNS